MLIIDDCPLSFLIYNQRFCFLMFFLTLFKPLIFINSALLTDLQGKGQLCKAAKCFTMFVASQSTGVLSANLLITTSLSCWKITLLQSSLITLLYSLFSTQCLHFSIKHNQLISATLSVSFILIYITC